MNIANEIGVLFACVLFYITGFMSGRVKLPKNNPINTTDKKIGDK